MVETPARRRRAGAADRHVLDGLMALSRAVVAITSRSLSDAGEVVTLTQFRTLVVLASRGPQRVADLATSLAVQPSTVTRLCDRLVARGLAIRRQSDTDRRVVRVLLTTEGRDLVGQVMARRRELFTQILRQLSIEDPMAFANNAQRVAVAAGELPEPEWWVQWEGSAQPYADPVLTATGTQQ